MSTCLSLQTLEEVAAGTLESSSIGDHLHACRECRRRLEEIRTNNEFLNRFGARLPRHEPPLAASAEADEIPGYEIERVIGRGGQGLVYEAIQMSTGRRVAVKVLLFGTLSGSSRVARFEREILLATQLRRPHIVTLYDGGLTSGGRPYFAMELIEGVPIDRYAGAAGPEPSDPDHLLPVGETLAVFEKVCAAIRHAHQRGIIHRDLKPANVLVDAEGQPHVLDFGLAKQAGAPPGAELTETGNWIGTLAFAAPEQLHGDPEAPDTRTDVYALGVILYRVLTGRHPYPVTGTLAEAVANIETCTPPPPSRWRPRIGDEIDTIVLKALAKEPERRYESAAALLEDLRRLHEGRPIAAKRDSTWYLLRKIALRHRHVVAWSAGFVAVAVALGAWTWNAERRARQTARALAVRLAESEIERSRTMGQPEGEDLLWRHHLLRSDPPSTGQPFLLNDPPGPRLSYWALWNLYRRHPCLATSTACTADVSTVRFAGDSGDTVHSACEDGAVHRWRPERGAALETLFRTPRSDGRRLSGDGRRLATWRERSWVVWDVERGAIVGSGDSSERISTLAIDWTGERVAISTAGGAVQIIDARGEGLLWERPDGLAPVVAIEVSPDGRWLAARRAGGAIELWSVESREITQTLEANHPGTGGGALAFDRSGTLLAANRNAGDPTPPTWEIVAVFHLADSISDPWRPAGSFKSRHPEFAALDIQEDLVIAAQWDQVIAWPFPPQGAPAERGAFEGHDREVRAVALSPGGEGLASAARNGLHKLWETRLDGFFEPLEESQSGSFHSVAFSRDGRFLAASGSEGRRPGGSILIWDARSRRCVARARRATTRSSPRSTGRRTRADSPRPPMTERCACGSSRRREGRGSCAKRGAPSR